MSGRRGGAFRNPNGLPTKLCAACGRPFTWRKKWARDWEAVRYCSERCRRAGSGGDKGPESGGADRSASQ